MDWSRSLRDALRERALTRAAQNGIAHDKSLGQAPTVLFERAPDGANVGGWSGRSRPLDPCCGQTRAIDAYGVTVNVPGCVPRFFHGTMRDGRLLVQPQRPTEFPPRPETLTAHEVEWDNSWDSAAEGTPRTRRDDLRLRRLNKITAPITANPRSTGSAVPHLGRSWSRSDAFPGNPCKFLLGGFSISALCLPLTPAIHSLGLDY